MDINGLLIELFDRIPPAAHAAVHGLDPETLLAAPRQGANPIAWLIWHLTRVQDHHVSGAFGLGQIYLDGDWAARFGLTADPEDHGYGHDAAQVAAVRPRGPADLTGYLDAVADRTRRLLGGVTPDDLDRVVDRAWDPPVTLGVRLASVAEDCLQHLGQAAYVRGLLTP